MIRPQANSSVTCVRVCVCVVYVHFLVSGTATCQGSRSGWPATGAGAWTKLRVLIGVSNHVRSQGRLPGM